MIIDDHSHTFFLCPQPHFPWFDEVSFGATRDFVIQDKGNESQKWVERPARRRLEPWVAWGWKENVEGKPGKTWFRLEFPWENMDI